MGTRCCNHLCLAPDHCVAETMPAFTQSCWPQTHGHSIFAVFRAQWNDESGLGGSWKGDNNGVRENGERKGRVLGGRVRKARQLCKIWRVLCDWCLLRRTEITHTFSTSAFVTLMSASIFSKYCCALSASLQSLSNFLLH